jgi:hypothetical protein
MATSLSTLSFLITLLATSPSIFAQSDSISAAASAAPATISGSTVTQALTATNQVTDSINTNLPQTAAATVEGFTIP